MKKSLLLIPAAAVLLTGCSSINTNADQQGLAYDAGSWSDTTFEECVKPGTQEYYGPGDQQYVYPSGTRTYTFDNPGDRGTIDVADKDGQPLTVAGILTFTVANDCEALREFHERIGLKYGADDEGVAEWGNLLDDYLGQPLRSAMRDAAADYTWRELYSDAAKRTAWEGQVKELLPDYVRDLAQGDYFTNFTLLVQTPQPGGGLLKQIEEQNAQTERLNTIARQKTAQDEEIDQIRQLVEILGPDGYIMYRNQLNCDDGDDKTACIPFIPVPQGSDINVTPGG